MTIDVAAAAANKTVQLVVGSLAIVGAILIPVTAIQTIQIHGFLWMSGLKDEIAVADAAKTKAQSYLAIQTGNVATLRGGLKTCNASIDDLKASGAQADANAKANLAALVESQAALKTARSRLAAVPASAATCPSVDAIFDGAFK